MPEAVFISIRARRSAEGGRRATVEAFALRADRHVTLTTIAPRPLVTERPFAEAFRALSLVREGA